MTSSKIAGKLKIRPMEPEDIASVLEIDRALTGKQRALTYTDLITGDLGGVLDLSFVAEVSSRVAGFLLGQHAFIGEPVTEVGLIQILGVHPDYQHKGVATQLVNAFLEHCKERDLKTVRIMVNERDSQLKEFFESLDFQRGKLIDYSKNL